MAISFVWKGDDNTLTGEWPALKRRGFIFQTALIFAGTAALRAAGVPE
jgi:hypothetical protein